MSWPSLTCVERPWPRLSCAMTRYPLFRKYRSWLSQSSLLRGQPWWKTTGWASRGPQSLYAIVTPSLVVMVFMRIPPVGAGVLFGEGHRSRVMPAHTETASSWRRRFEQVPLAIRTSERDGPVDQAPNRSEESPVHRLYTDEPPASAAIAAIRTGDVARLRTLLAENPRIISAFVVDRSTPGQGRTLLHVVTDWPGHHPHGAETVALLVAAGADVNARFVGPVAETPLHWAASNDDVAVLDALLDHGADIDAPGGAIAGGSPLSDAVGFGQWNAARRL